jgi:hypothetical protein
MANAWLDRTNGYVPGEKIQFNANIDNFSGKSVRSTHPGDSIYVLIYSKMIANLPPPLNVNSTRRSPMGNTWQENSLAK